MAEPNLLGKAMSAMTKTWEETFAEQNHQIRQRMGTSSFEEIRGAYRELEQRTMSAVADEPDRLAIKRRAAEWLLYAAIKMDRPLEECRALLDEVSKLGFTSPQDRVTIVVCSRVAA